MNDRTGTGAYELGSVFARTFRGEDGTRALAYLRTLTLERHLGPEASIAQLRHLEGQRHLVNLILSLVRRGREGQPFDIETKES
ncbi:MAG: hypothetical protein HZA67_03450 [Rhodospirillales bacterium]|jgi:hypothetical protein|nr:hypothetical protein [Rhodospirillales bacterium]MDK9721670.1 hypothetical protein [Rhodospirillales bacterium]